MSLIASRNKGYEGAVRALDNVNLTIPLGLYVLLRLNGADKSTLMRTIATLQEPDPGSIHMDGLDLDMLRSKDEDRKMLGYCPILGGCYREQLSHPIRRRQGQHHITPE